MMHEYSKSSEFFNFLKEYVYCICQSACVKVCGCNLGKCLFAYKFYEYSLAFIH